MSADFVPLLQGLRSRLAQPAHGAADSFTPVISASPLPASELTSGRPNQPHGCDEVKVELKRDGEKIQEIRIHCKCGEVIELLCEY